MATATDTKSGMETMTGLHWLGVVLAAVTGAVHVALFTFQGTTPMGLAFLFAGIVFFAASAAVIADFYRQQLYLLGIPFTAGQIPIWFWVNGVVGGRIVIEPLLSPISVVDKLAQIGLVAVLVVLYRRESGV